MKIMIMTIKRYDHDRNNKCNRDYDPNFDLERICNHDFDHNRNCNCDFDTNFDRNRNCNCNFDPNFDRKKLHHNCQMYNGHNTIKNKIK